MATLEITENCTERTRGYTGKLLDTRKMADHEEALYSGRRDDSPVDHDSRNEREGSRESDHDDRDQRRRGGGYERDLRRESRRFAPYPSQDERSSSRGQSGSGGKECRVYVWNLPYQVRWQDLKDYMKKGIVTFLLFTPFEGFFYFAAKRGYITLKLRFSFSCIVPNCMLHIVTWLLEFAEAYFGELIAELQLLA